MPFADASFDHATSISVLEHIAGEGGDAAALAELVRCVRPGGRLAITLPHAEESYVEYRESPAYVDHGERDDRGCVFFQRWYDDAAVERLILGAPALQLVESSVVRLQPNLNTAYVRTFPLSCRWARPTGCSRGSVAGPAGT